MDIEVMDAQGVSTFFCVAGHAPIWGPEGCEREFEAMVITNQETTMPAGEDRVNDTAELICT